LRDVGVEASACAMLTEDAMQQTRLLVDNPCPVTYADALAMYQATW